MRRRKDVIRLEVPVGTDAMIQARVAPLLPDGVRSIAGWLVDAIVRAAYIQGALDALIIAEHHPEIIESVHGPLRQNGLQGL